MKGCGELVDGVLLYVQGDKRGAMQKLTSRRTLALFVILAGALGNFADRVGRGYVVDFMHVPHWPVFTVSDIYVCMGVIALLLFGTSLNAPSRAPA